MFALAGCAFGLILYSYDDWFDQSGLRHSFIHRIATTCEILLLGPGMGLLAFAVSEYARLKDEAVMQARQQAAQQRFLALGRVAASVAHEVRNPLHNIRLILDELHAEGGLRASDPLAVRLDANLERINQAVALVYQLAKPAGLESGAEDEADLARLVPEAAIAEERRVPAMPPITVEVPPGDHRVACAVGSVRIILDNLLRNASAATGNAGGIRMVLRSSSDRVDVVVSNPGRLPEELAGDGTNEPLTSTKITGLGLGVFISRQIANQAGGSLRLAQAGSDVEATLALPRKGSR